MKELPRRCVVDTNVPATANRANPSASDDFVAKCARALRELMKGGHVFIDDGDRIISEYRANLRASGEPGPGDAFVKWLLTHAWGGTCVTRVTITPRDGDPEDFEELPLPADTTIYDRSDRKFLAVAAAHPSRPPILQALDSKWWGWTDALDEVQVRVHFLCKAEIEQKHRQKMGSD